MDSTSPTIVIKSMEFARVLKLVVVLFVAVAVPCLVIFSAYHSNFGQFLPSLSFSSSLHSANGTDLSLVDLQDELIHDEHYELRKVLKEASTKDKTVILATLNEAWAAPNSIFDVFLESFRIGNNTARLLNHIVVIAVDEKAYTRCLDLVSHCYFLKSNKSTELAHEARFMSPSYVELVWERLAFLQTILSLGYNFVQTDTDVVWFRDPFPLFDPITDFQTSCDRFNGKPFDLNNFPNVGFMFVRSNNRTMEFYKFWISSRSNYSHLHEQDAFNKIKHDPFVNQIGLKMRFFDTDYFGGFCTPSRDFNKVCTMHANCCVGLERKIADLNTTLEDWKIFLSVSPNQTASQRFHWRVPHICHM